MNVRELVNVLKFKTDSASLKAAEASVNRIKAMMQKIRPASLRFNTGNFGDVQTKITGLSNAISKINGRSINIRTNTGSVASASKKVQALSSQVAKANKTITVKANASVGMAKKQIQSLNTQVANANKTVRIKTNVDTTTATKRIQNLSNVVAKANKTIVVKANTNSLTTASKRVQTLQGAVTRLNGKTVNVRTSTAGLTNLQRKVDSVQKRLDILNRAKMRAVKIGADTTGIDKAIAKLKELDRTQQRMIHNGFKAKAQGAMQQGTMQQPSSGGGGMSALAGGLKGAFVAFGGMAIVSEIKETADAMMSLSSRIRLVTQNDAERLQIESRLYQMSMKNRASLEDIGDLYYKTALSASRFGATQEDVLRLTDIVSKSLIIGGADTAQQKSTILQLSQALGSGVLQGDELRSLRENAPILMDQISKFFGVSMAGLKEMGAKGELTTERLMQAILASGSTIDSQMGKITPTIGQAITVLGNKWSKFILDVQNSTGFFGQVAQLILDAVDLVGQAIDWVKAEFGTATPEMMGMIEDFKALWQSLQPLIQAIGTIFMNWIVPALKIFGKVAASVLGMAATLLQPIVDLLSKIADIIATISGGLPGILKGMDSMISKAESGAIEKYNSLVVNQNNNVNVNSAEEASTYVADSMPMEFASPD